MYPYKVDLAEEYVLELVNDKLDEGFDLISDEEVDKKSQLSDVEGDDSSLSFKSVQEFVRHLEVEELDLDNGKENKIMTTRCVKEDISGNQPILIRGLWDS